jgi:hypothetical protein
MLAQRFHPNVRKKLVESFAAFISTTGSLGSG